MPWFTVRLQSAEAFSAAETVRATYPTFLERPNWPTERAAAFVRYDPPTGETVFYFPPHSRRAEPFNVEYYHAGVCSPPTRQVGLALLVGQSGAIELLVE